MKSSTLHKSSLSVQRKNGMAHIRTDSFGIIFRVSGVLFHSLCDGGVCQSHC